MQTVTSRIAPSPGPPSAALSPAPFSTAEEFSDLVTPEILGMLRAARRMLPSDDLAWDAVQETLARVWRSGVLARPPRAALRRLVAYSALHLARCARRRLQHEGHVLASPCCVDDPFGDAVSAELRAVVRAALARLTAPHRRVFELFELEGRDYEDIARALAVPVGTVRSRLHRARRELRARMGESWALGPE
jgi:RNA polymerase sigma-70 factor (ECF subfamily)